MTLSNISLRNKIIALVMLALAAAALFFYFRRDDAPKKLGNVSGEQTPALTQTINGLLADPAEAYRRPAAVMIENDPDARPQSGLSNADIVYETLAEGGITRYEAIYQTSDEARLGPVRSARPYFAEIADEYNPLYAHVGGSNEALTGLHEGKYTGVEDVDEYFFGPYFERIKSRPGPHNVYTTLSRLRQVIIDKDWSASASVNSWLFSDEPKTSTTLASDISFDFSTPLFAARFMYDAKTSSYARILADKADVDQETKKQIFVTTVIAQLVDVADIPNDPKLRVNIDLDSGGVAHIFYRGQLITGTWKKENNRTRYYDEAGQEIVFPRGKMWIGLVPNTQDSATWK